MIVFDTRETPRAESSVGSQSSSGRRVLSPETAWLIADVLGDDAARAPGFGRDGVLHVPGRTVAVKTGTTSDFRDNWTIGFTPDVVVGVWVGNADNHAMRDVSGISGAAPLWRDVLDGVLQNQPPTSFQRPPDLVQVTLCADTEARAGPDCPAHRLEWLVSKAADVAQPARTQDAARMVPPPALRITFPDPGTVIVLDPMLPSAAQRVPIEIAADTTITSFQILVDGVIIGERSAPGHMGGRWSSGPVGWPPTPGHHVLRAVSDQGVESGSVEMEVVPSAAEPTANDRNP